VEQSLPCILRMGCYETDGFAPKNIHGNARKMNLSYQSDRR